MTTVGMLGAGRMGSAMGRSIAREGFDLVVYNRSADKAQELADATGGRVCDSPADVAAASDVVISMVSDGAAVDALYRRPRGVLEGLRPGTVAVDMSTVLPETIRGLEREVRAMGAGILDAPVSGSVSVAEAGELTLMVGGEAADLERARPALEAVSKRIFHMGPLGAGATIKLCVNAIVFGLNGSVAESLVLAEHAGIDRELAYDVFASSAIAAPLVQYKRAAFVRPEETPVAFSIDLAAKDLRLIHQLADASGARMPQADMNLALLEEAGGAVGGSRDMSALADHLREGRP